MPIPRAARHTADRLDEIKRAVADGTAKATLDAYDSTFLDSLRGRLQIFRTLTPSQSAKLASIEDAVLGPEAADTSTGQLF